MALLSYWTGAISSPSSVEASTQPVTRDLLVEELSLIILAHAG